MVAKKETNQLKCPACGHECPVTDAEGVLVPDPKCPKCFKIAGKKINMVVDEQEKTPVLSGKDMNTLLYLLLGKVGTIEIPQEVFGNAPGPEKLKIEMQWDETHKVWRFFNKKKPKNRKPKLVLPKKRVILPN
jgi:hypothetical protein